MASRLRIADVAQEKLEETPRAIRVQALTFLVDVAKNPGDYEFEPVKGALTVSKGFKDDNVPATKYRIVFAVEEDLARELFTVLNCAIATWPG